jgi:hypothetical protein
MSCVQELSELGPRADLSWVQELTELAELKKLGELSSSHLPFQMEDVCISFLHLAWKNFATTGELTFENQLAKKVMIPRPLQGVCN